ncbi:MAG TPA: YCF48-related protein [Thermoleophilia bacterium]|nr:YCF48-related protein [Thermoleophilia bacterium]
MRGYQRVLSSLIVAVFALPVLTGCAGVVSQQTPSDTSPLPDSGVHAWAVGTYGTIVATTDGGTHWTSQPSGTNHGLAAVSFADASHGWAVGGYPVIGGRRQRLILATTDGGMGWTPQLKDSGLPLTAVATADATHVWVGGGASVPAIRASSDGGSTWTTQYRGTVKGAVDDIAFADNAHGWAVAVLGSWMDANVGVEVLGTTDSGAHWTIQKTMRGDPYSWSVAFADATHGWIVGTKGGGTKARVWTTSDGGSTWTLTPTQPKGMIASMDALACVDPLHVWTGGTSPTPFFRSSDGGQTWVATTKTLVGVRAMAFGDTSHGWVVTLDGSTTRIMATDDGGVTWTRQAKIPLPGHVRQPGQNSPQLLDITCLR